MDFQINEDKIAQLVADKLTDERGFRENVVARLENDAHKAAASLTKDVGAKIIDDAVNAVAANWREFKIRRTNNWGEPLRDQDAISLPQWIEQEIYSTRYGGEKQLAEKIRDAIGKQVAEHVKVTIAELNKEFAAAIAVAVTEQFSKITTGRR